MIRKNYLQIIVCCVLLGIISLPTINIVKGISNNIEFNHLVSTTKNLNTQLNSVNSEIQQYQNSIMKYGESEGINVNSVSSLYNMVSKLSGVTNVQAQIINFNADGSTTQVCKYNPNMQVATANGIKIEITAKDIKSVINELESKRIPCYSMNIIYPENKLTVIYNTGGLNNV